MYQSLSTVSVLCFFLIGGCGGDGFSLRTDSFHLTVSDEGWVVHMRDPASGNDHASRPSPLAQIRRHGMYYRPVSADGSPDAIRLRFEDGTTADISVHEKPSHVTLELSAISGADSVDLFLWGPFASSLHASIGETVGIVQGDEYTIGIQALNIRTLGGYPWYEDDHMPQKDLQEGTEYHDVDAATSRYVLFQVEAAKPDSMGSSLQAFTRNRLRTRVIPNRGYERYTVPPLDDGGIVGSRIALFGVPNSIALETIGDIELEEGLAHPNIDGEWSKESPMASAAYLITAFSEETADRVMDLTEQAGLRYMYHPEPFLNWGHFDLNPDLFPNGREGLRRIVDRAAGRGLKVGTHNLSNFVSTNDPYVTPVPDARLAKVGRSRLVSNVDRSQTFIPIQDPGFFNQARKSTLSAAQIGNEIVVFESVSDQAPWKLLGVRRGAFGTNVTAHRKGSDVAMLDDHPYRVFLTETALSIEMAETLARLYNETGLRQISFDGLEGNWSTGLGTYGESLFAQTWYDNLNEDIRSHFIADASRTTHFFWHVYTRMNWGEPWYAGFRESQTEYRLKNQEYFRRNLMPRMLGWFQLTPKTTVEDIEWMLSLSAGYDAGYALFSELETFDQNGRVDEILHLIGQWEEARLGGAFSEDQKARLRAREQEFRLESTGSGTWALIPVSVHIFRRFNRERQPGEPIQSNFEFDSGAGERAAGFIVTAEEGAAENISFTIDNNAAIRLLGPIREGESVVYSGGDSAVHYSPTWQVLGRVNMDASSVRLSPGRHAVSLTADIDGEAEAAVRLELRFPGEAEPVSLAG